ncbi:XtrA/YqaO family protein [Bacillus thuringiensis]
MIVKHGNINLTQSLENSKTKIITLQGKVKRVRFDEGEEF